MKLSFKKRIEIKLFGKFKLLTINFDYVERGRNNDTEDDAYYIELEDRTIEQDDD